MSFSWFLVGALAGAGGMYVAAKEKVWKPNPIGGTHAILRQYAEQNGWDEEEQLDVLSEYIDNQKADDAFDDFLDQSEGEALFDVMVQYIDNQRADDAFEDFLANWV